MKRLPLIAAALLSSVAAVRFAPFDDVVTVRVSAPGMPGGYLVVNKTDFEADPGKYGDGSLWVDPGVPAARAAAPAATEPPAVTPTPAATAPVATPAPAKTYADPNGVRYIQQQGERWYHVDQQGNRFQQQSATGYATQEAANAAAAAKPPAV